MTDIAQLLDRLAADGLSLATAESLTGGLLGDAVAAVPGASRVYKGGVIAYADEVKTDVLGVDPDLLAYSGAVSAGVAEAMAHAVRDKTGADIAVAVTGIAGPAGARPGKPVGTVWFAVLGPKRVLMVQRAHLEGDRSDIRRLAVAEALAMVEENLLEAEREGQVIVPVVPGEA